MLKILSNIDIDKLVLLSQESDFPFKLERLTAEKFCQGDLSCQTYGVFIEDELISVMTFSLCQVFPILIIQQEI